MLALTCTRTRLSYAPPSLMPGEEAVVKSWIPILIEVKAGAAPKQSRRGSQDPQVILRSADALPAAADGLEPDRGRRHGYGAGFRDGALADDAAGTVEALVEEVPARKVGVGRARGGVHTTLQVITDDIDAVGGRGGTRCDHPGVVLGPGAAARARPDGMVGRLHLQHALAGADVTCEQLVARPALPVAVGAPRLRDVGDGRHAVVPDEPAGAVVSREPYGRGQH